MEEQATVAPDQEATPEAVTEEQAETEQTEVEQTEGQSESETSQDDDAKKTRNQRRKEAMARAHREREEAEQLLREHQDRIRKAQEVAQGSEQPREDKFNSYEEYLVALGAWHAGQTLDQRQEAEMRRQADEYQQQVTQASEREKAEVAQGWADQVVEAKSRYADFENVAYSAPISDAMADIIARMDRGADVAYQLGLDRARAQEIAALPPIQQAMELTRIEVGLNAPKPRTQTQAPDPVAPVKPKASVSKDPEKMSMAEYRKWRAGQK